MRSGKKSDLAICLEELAESTIDAPTTEVIILDGGVIVHMLVPRNCKTFHDYAIKIFLPYIETQCEKANRVDLIWDAYHPNSLKSST